MEITREEALAVFGTKYYFTEADNLIAETEMGIARHLNAGGRVEDAKTQLMVSALGRRLGGDFSMSVTYHTDGTHSVVIGRKQ